MISDFLRRIARVLQGYDPFVKPEKFTRPEQLENLNSAAGLFKTTPPVRLKELFKNHFKDPAGEKFFDIAEDLFRAKTIPSKAQDAWDLEMLKYRKSGPTQIEKKEDSPFL